MKVRPLVLLSIILAALALSACGRTKVIGVWKKESFSGPPLRSIIILAQTGKNYNRSAWENITAERFQRDGLHSIPALSGFSADRTVNPHQVLSYAQENGIDGVLVIRYVDTQTLQIYHPPRTEYYYADRYYYPYSWGYSPVYPFPYGYHRYPYRGHYRIYRPYFYVEEILVTPGYTTSHKAVRVESYLYTSWSREQVWSLTSETIDPRSANQLIEDVSQTVFQSLRKYRLITLSQ